MFHGPILSHFGVPQVIRPSVIGMVKERKRKIIGEEFVNVFEEEASKIKDARFLAQVAAQNADQLLSKGHGSMRSWTYAICF